MTDITVHGDTKILLLTCKGLFGGKQMSLEDASGALKISVPAQLWPWMNPGDQVYTTLGVFIAKPADAPLPGLIGGMN
jgi:hypothetical protein